MTIPAHFDDHSLKATFAFRHGELDKAGWAVRLCSRFGYFTPDVCYEATVDRLLLDGASWLEIGGGKAIFPSNPRLSAALASRCSLLVGVDPSKNIFDNPFVHQKVQGLLEEFQSPTAFDLATARMVVEHVAQPKKFAAALSRLLRPGGTAVILTVDRWAPVTILSHATPFWFHVFLKRLLWSTDDEDTFPTVYKMNTRRDLARLFAPAGLEEVAFYCLDDCRTLARWKFTYALELITRKFLRRIGLGYPEQCLLGVYRKSPMPPPTSETA